MNHHGEQADRIIVVIQSAMYTPKYAPVSLSVPWSVQNLIHTGGMRPMMMYPVARQTNTRIMGVGTELK